MKKILLTIATIGLLAGFAACKSDDDETTWDKYADWRELNDNWLTDMQNRRNPDGTAYYTKLVPTWNPGIYVLIHYFNDRAETAGNLSPLYTSTVDVRYIGRDCQGVGFDSSTYVNTYGDGIQRFACNSVIQGWSVALQDMHVGDSVELIVPYQAGYGSSTGMAVKPYSNLQFFLRLADIYKYEAR